MTKVAVDIVVEITFDMKQPERSSIRTNAKSEALEEILTAWLMNQIGAGADPSPPVERDAYVIKIGLVLEDDSFCTESDTGNKALTCGLVMDTLGRLKDISVLPFESDPRYADGRPPPADPR